jgi:uncharacterized Zn finger protein
MIPKSFLSLFIVFRKINRNLSASCTCPAGENGQKCKHRINILNGITNGIVSGNEAEVLKVVSWLPETDVEGALKALMAAEERYEMAKRELAMAKKKLTGAFRD